MRHACDERCEQVGLGLGVLGVVAYSNVESSLDVFTQESRTDKDPFACSRTHQSARKRGKKAHFTNIHGLMEIESGEVSPLFADADESTGGDESFSDASGAGSRVWGR